MKLLFGGSFDPIHRGHLSLIARVVERYSPEQVLIVPSSQRINKRPHVFSGAFRTELICTAVAELPSEVQECIEVSDFELRHNRPVYTYETVQALKPDALLLGSDLEYTRWKYFDEIIRPAISRVLVVPREPGPRAPRSPMEHILDHGVCAVSSRQIIARLIQHQTIGDLVPACIAAAIEHQFSEHLTNQALVLPGSQVSSAHC